MQITHEEARKLIHLDIDHALNSGKRMILSTHLLDCSDCRAYADEIKEVENILLPVMKSQWNAASIPLSISMLNAKSKSKIQAGIFLATRTALAGFVFIAFVFSAWQFMTSRTQMSGSLPVGVLPVPTPSTQTTRTAVISGNCETTVYVVQRNDTLTRIAYRFSVSKEEIMTFNHLKTETVNTAMRLLIPVCNFTPTGTLNPATNTTTYTPVMNLVTSTPGG